MKDAYLLSGNQSRCFTLLMVLAAHGCLLYALLHHRPAALQRENSERWSTVWWVPLQQAPITRPETLPPSSPIQRPHINSRPPQVSASKEESTSTDSAQEKPEPITPPVDWHAEATISAKGLAAELNAKPKQRSLDSHIEKVQPPAQRAEFGWRPGAQRFGFTPEGLPYFRIGERCIYLMFMVACAFGGAQEPNSTLLEGMNDPNAPQGSVPDIKELR